MFSLKILTAVTLIGFITISSLIKVSFGADGGVRIESVLPTSDSEDGVRIEFSTGDAIGLPIFNVPFSCSDSGPCDDSDDGSTGNDDEDGGEDDDGGNDDEDGGEDDDDNEDCECPDVPEPEECDCDENPLACPTIPGLTKDLQFATTNINDDESDHKDLPYIRTVPRTVFINWESYDTLRNTGKVLAIDVEHDDCSYSIGGVTGITRYYLQRILFKWNCTGLAATRIKDGNKYERGTQLKVIWIYSRACNGRFAEDEDSESDEYLAISDFITVGKRRNRRFRPVENAIRKVIGNPGTSTKLYRRDLLDWRFEGKANHFQEWSYVYRGRSIDRESGEPGKNTTFMTHDNWCAGISSSQFEVFCPADRTLHIGDAVVSPEQDRPVYIAGPTTFYSSSQHYECYKKEDK